MTVVGALRVHGLRLTVVAIVAGVFAIVAVMPGTDHWLSSRARSHADGPDPEYDVSLDSDALHTAGQLMSRVGGTYYVYVPSGQPELLGAIDGALRLWAVPAIPLEWSNLHPTWVFSYDTKRLAPPGTRVAHVYSIGPGIRLIRTSW